MEQGREIEEERAYEEMRRKVERLSQPLSSAPFPSGKGGSGGAVGRSETMAPAAERLKESK